MEEKKQQEDQVGILDRITVYISKALRNRMDKYTEAKGFTNRSEMLRQAFRILERIFPLNQTGNPQLSFEEQFANINKKLDEIMLKIRKNLQDQALIQNQESELELEYHEFNETITHFTPETIPQFKALSEEIMKLIKTTPENSIKDFVLMDYFRNKGYAESLIWAILVILKDRKKLQLEGGEWKFYGEKTR